MVYKRLRTIQHLLLKVSIGLLGLLMIVGLFGCEDEGLPNTIEENQRIVQSQTETAGYDDAELQKLYAFTDFRQTGKSIALTHQGVIDPQGLTQLNEILQSQKDAGEIKEYQFIKSYAISSGKYPNLYPSTTILITLTESEQ